MCLNSGRMREQRHTVGAGQWPIAECPTSGGGVRRSAGILAGGFAELSSSVFPQPRHRPSPARLSMPKSKWVTVGYTFENFSTKVRVSQSKSDL